MTVQCRELPYCVCDGEMVRESCSHMEECEERCSALVLCGVCDWTSTAWHLSPGPVFVQKPQTAAVLGGCVWTIRQQTPHRSTGALLLHF